MVRALGLALAALGALAALPAWAQQQPLALTRECQAGNTATATESPLPNVAAALQRKKRVKILAICGPRRKGRRRRRRRRGALRAFCLRPDVVRQRRELFRSFRRPCCARARCAGPCA